MSQIPWSDERVAELRLGFEQNRSVSAMSEYFGISRGAIIGKLHRLGLRRQEAKPRGSRQRSAEELAAAKERRRVLHAIAQRKRRQRARGSAVEDTSQRASAVVQPAMAETYAPLGIPFADLEPFSRKKSNQCRFMAAEEPAPEYRVCGIETDPGQSYCARCKTIVHDYHKPTEAEMARRRIVSMAMKRHHAMRSGV